MVDITIGMIRPVPNNPGKRDRQGQGSKEKRKKKTEKRQNGNGIVVTISHPADREQQPKRR